jgi:hypothetical protein
MTAGRPSKYDPAFIEQVLPFMEQSYSTTALAGCTVIYALCDASGVPFYVGKSKNIKKRLQSYASMNAHGNKALLGKLQDWRHHQKWFALSINPEDVTKEEYMWINRLDGLCNIMVKPFQAKSRKPWVAMGVKCPTAQVRQHVKRNLSGNVDWVKDYCDSLNESERLEFECAVALASFNTCLGPSMRRWADGVVGK